MKTVGKKTSLVQLIILKSTPDIAPNLRQLFNGKSYLLLQDKLSIKKSCLPYMAKQNYSVGSWEFTARHCSSNNYTRKPTMHVCLSKLSASFVCGTLPQANTFQIKTLKILTFNYELYLILPKKNTTKNKYISF